LHLMLLLAAAVCDLPTGTVSLCLAVDSARTAVGRSTMLLARQSGTRCLMNLEILTVLIVLNGLWKQFSVAATSLTSALEVIFYNEMRYIRFTLLYFTYLSISLSVTACIALLLNFVLLKQSTCNIVLQ